jgi:hypothetical protein
MEKTMTGYREMVDARVLGMYERHFWAGFTAYVSPVAAWCDRPEAALEAMKGLVSSGYGHLPSGTMIGRSAVFARYPDWTGRWWRFYLVTASGSEFVTCYVDNRQGQAQALADAMSAVRATS